MPTSDLRYKCLGYVALNVSDPARTASFYREMLGLEQVATLPDGTTLLRCSDKHQDVVLVPSALPGLKRIAWQMESAQALEQARAHLPSIGMPVIPVPEEELQALALGQAFRSVEPTTGITFEFFATPASFGRFSATHTKIARLGHAVIKAPDREKTARFLADQLNFRSSDEVEGATTFLRCFPNPYHHSLGVASGPLSFHHLNFMVTDIDDIGRAMRRLQKNSVEITYGPGRHPTSNSIFLYFLDPDRLTLEFSFGMETFPEIDAREPRIFPRTEDSLDTWGGPRPGPGHARVGTIELRQQ